MSRRSTEEQARADAERSKTRPASSTETEISIPLLSFLSPLLYLLSHLPLSFLPSPSSSLFPTSSSFSPISAQISLTMAICTIGNVPSEFIFHGATGLPNPRHEGLRRRVWGYPFHDYYIT